MTAANHLKYGMFAINRTLVIAPKKVAQGTWSREAQKWDHLQHLRVVKVLGSQKQRIRALNTPGDIYITNRDNVVWIVEYYRNAWPFDLVILDESTSFKNPRAKRFKALTWARPHMGRVVELTGTPAPRGLMDLWAQVYLLDQGARLGRTAEGYRTRYFNPDRRSRDRVFTYALKPEAERTIWEKVSDICVSMKSEDYLQLPELVNVTTPVVLDDKAKAAYTKLERDMLLEVEGQLLTAMSAGVLTGKLLQLCNGSVYDEDRQPVEIHRCKIEALLELLEELNGQPALLLYNYKHDLARIHKALEGSGLVVRELRTPEDEDAWNRGEINVLLAHPQSSAYGLNLQDGGNHVIWFGLQWSLELYIQAIGRLYRQGQQSSRVIVHHLVVEGGMDEDVMAVLEERGSTQERLMDALKARIDRVLAEG